MPAISSKELLEGLANKGPRAIGKAMESETLDWIFEILRPRFARQLQSQTNQQQTDPRVRAKKLIEETLKG